LFAFVAVITSAVAAAPSAAARPSHGVPPTVTTVRLDTGTQQPDGSGTEREIEHGEGFSLVALRWDQPAAKPARIEFSARTSDGKWGGWTAVDPIDNSPDKNRRGGVAGAAQTASEPLWVGKSTAVRVRVTGAGHAPDPATMDVVLVDPGQAPTDANPAVAPAALAASTTGVSAPQVVSRAGWGADEQIRTDCLAANPPEPLYASTVKAATLHHTAGTNDYTAADAPAIVRSIYAYHAQTLNWCDIGYNALVDRFGTIYEGRYGGLDAPVWGTHAGGFNKYTSGIAMMGSYTDVAPPAETIDAVARFVAWKFARGYIDPAGTATLVSGGGGTTFYPAGTSVTLPTLFGHRDVGSTECPGNLGYAQLPALRDQVAQLMGDWRSSPIYAKWSASGGATGPIGEVYTLERDLPGGLVTTFDSGNRSVYWSAPTGAHVIQGAIRDRWIALDADTGLLGYPVTDELTTPDQIGRFNHFSGTAGSIYWTPSTGAEEIYGAIRDRWAALGWERGPLGYPATGERGTPDGVGRYNHFSSGGSVYWTPTTGAQDVYGAIRSRWAALGWERSYLGYPTSGEFAVPGGRRSNFQNGYITWDAASGRVTDIRY
jgi:uncharacterized protein with LGFP repeats